MSERPSEGKKILVLNGSPRRGASCTMLVTEAFVDGIRSVCRCDVETVNLSDLKITPCTGCLSCWGRTEGECVIKNDDIPALKEKIGQADIFIESFPLYFFGMPGQMKVFCDRMLSMMLTYKGQNPPADGESFHGLRTPREGRKFVVISSCAYTKTDAVYDPLLKQLDCICGRDKYLPILVPQLFTLAKLDAEARKKRFLNKFTEAGRLFGEQGTLSGEALANLSKPPFAEETYKVLLNGFWQSEKNR